MPARIISCECKHVGQDNLHGPGRRVYNQTREQDGKVWRCSICLKTKTVGGEDDSKKKGK